MTRNTSSMPIAIKPWYGSLCLVDDSCLRYIILRKIAVTFKLVQHILFNRESLFLDIYLYSTVPTFTTGNEDWRIPWVI
jgi:hypothetical protein